jgi:hypothetical protein
MSADGSRVFFHTPDPLSPEDTNGKSDVYEWQAPGSANCELPGGCLRLISDGQADTNSYFGDANASGDDVYILTTGRLVGWDRDSNLDLYDARVEGGLPEPQSGASCSGEGCQGRSTGPAGTSSPGSATVLGHGNATTSHPGQAQKHRHKKHRKHKKPRHHRSRHKRQSMSRSHSTHRRAKSTTNGNQGESK